MFIKKVYLILKDLLNVDLKAAKRHLVEDLISFDILVFIPMKGRVNLIKFILVSNGSIGLSNVEKKAVVKASFK